MQISFKDGKMRKLCEDGKKLYKKYGKIQAGKIVQRINELLSAKNLYDISKLPQARLHKLSQNWKGCFAIDLKHPYRLILKPLNGNYLDYRSITEIKILTIIDYH